jgi:hypothetical protein
VFIEANTRPRLGQYHFQRGFAALKRIGSQIVAIQFNQIEGVEKYAFIVAAMANEIEQSHALLIASDSFAIDNARARAQASQRIDDQREAICEVIARAAIETHLWAFLAGNDAKAVMLGLVQPFAARRQCGFDWEAWRDEPGRERTLQHAD